MLCSILLILLTLFHALTLRFFSVDCYGDWFCIELDRQQGKAVITNITEFPVVVTVSCEWRNIQGKVQRFLKTVDLNNSLPVTLINLERKHKQIVRSFNYSARWAHGVLLAEHDPLAEYYNPLAPDQRYWLVQGFNGAFSHYGASRYAVDFAMPVGTPVMAARGGVVIDTEARFNKGGASRRYARYANYVVILHDDGTTGEYYHLQQHGVNVERGQQVVTGQLIGFSDNTGFSSLPHLHFAVYQALPDGKFQSIPFEFSTQPIKKEASTAD